MTCWQLKSFLDMIREHDYPTLHERNTLLPSHHAIAGCAKGIQTRWFIHQASIMIQARWLFLSRRWTDIWRIQCSFASSSFLALLHHPHPFRELLDAWMFGSLAFRLAHGLKVWPWDESLFMAYDWGKRLNLSGLAVGQAYFDELLKYIFTYSQIFIGNVSAMF